MQVADHEVRGVEVDAETRCAHYHTERDVVAIEFPCCGTFYPCFACHDAVADHPATRWPAADFDERAVLCGACGTELTISVYLDCESTCPACGTAFNPGCAAHVDRYFEV